MVCILNIEKKHLSDGIETIEKELLNVKIPRREVLRSLIAVEDILTAMFLHSSEDTVNVKIRSFMGNVSLHMRQKGEPFSLEDVRPFLSEEENDPDMRQAVSHYMSKVLGDGIEIANKRGINSCKIRIARSKHSTLIRNISALFLGLLVGQVLKLCLPAAAAAAISSTLFASGSTMFMNALKMVVGPLIFFSMAASVAEFSDLRALGKMVMKIVTGYLFTSIVAIGIGYGIYSLFPIGDASLVSLVNEKASDMVASGQNVSVSVKNVIVNIIPSDFIGPFLNSDMLQIIFMGVMLGIAIAILSERYPRAKEAVTCLNDIFSKITGLIIGFMPIAVFCAMAKMVIGMDLASLAKIAVWIPVCYAGDICMILAYMLLLFAAGRLNPIRFIQSYFPVMLTAYSLGSSNATMPVSLKYCGEKLGISKRLYSLSIPLGATINMDGSCVTLMISSLFMAKIFGVPITGTVLTALIVSIMALSVGAPGVPGGALVCLSILLPQIGIPAEGISIVMGLYSLAGMGLSCVNVTGDAVISTIVAKSEKLLDLDLYNAK